MRTLLWHPGRGAWVCRRTACQALVLFGWLLGVCAASAQTPDDLAPPSGKLRLQWDERRASRTDQQTGAAIVALELRSSAAHWNAIATLQHQGDAAQGPVNRAWFNELSATAELAGWQFSAGKKIVAWDVGYAFRPNDLVQQEQRRSLVSSTPEGRGVLMAESFELDRAWSLVWANPSHDPFDTGAQEPALAARVYQRQGPVDWHGFARMGAHTGASLGAAAAWVAGDALELHGSMRVGQNTQALLGGTWTHSSQLSVLAEVWWDGTAALDGLRRNIYGRVSWEHEGWQPALDLLYHPFDGGQLWTLALSHTGDRVQLQGGLRWAGGPAHALMRQQATSRQAFVMLSVPF